MKADISGNLTDSFWAEREGINLGYLIDIKGAYNTYGFEFELGYSQLVYELNS